jgi:hypothetical protein
MDGRFPTLVTPGYADDSPLSFPLRRWVDRPDSPDNLNPVEAYSPGNVCLKDPRPLGKVSASTCSSPELGEAVGRRRKYANGNFLFYGYPPELIARWCGVSQRTALLYKTGVRKPSRQALRLFTLHRDGRVLTSAFRDWAVHNDKLVNPEGQEYTQGQLRAYQIVMQLARELASKDPKKLDEYYEILRTA